MLVFSSNNHQLYIGYLTNIIEWNMIKGKFIGMMFVTIASSCLVTSCNGNDESLLNKDSISESLVMTRSEMESKKGMSNSEDLYRVTEEDAVKFSRSLHRDKDFKMDVYEIEKDTLLYLFNYEDGWLLVAGDKRINPIVAESESGNLSLDLPNENIMIWIDSYADEIRALKKYVKEVENEYTKLWSNLSRNRGESKKENGGTRDYKWAVIYYTYCDSYSDADVVPHLVSSKWGQGNPWNSKLPIDTSNGNNTCKIGCTAVAFGEIVYYMHYHLGKPTGLYHDISISNSTISGPTANIGFSRSNYVSNSTRWDDMALSTYSSGNTTYVGDLMLDIGNRLEMVYSGARSGATLTTNVANYYGLTFSHSAYNYQYVKNDLQNSKPVNVTAFRKVTSSEYVGHSWLIDGYGIRTLHYTTEIHFEYTENWMYEVEYYDTFDELRAHYHINSEYDIIEQDGGTYTNDYILMNWGEDTTYNNAHYSSYSSASWIVDDNKDFKYNKEINYDFR